MIEVSEGDGVGYAILTPHTPYSHIASLRVRVEAYAQGRGIGTKLVDEILEEAPKHGIRRVEATPYLDNPQSMSFFLRRPDFEFEGVRRKGGSRLGQGLRKELVDTALFAWVQPE